MSDTTNESKFTPGPWEVYESSEYSAMYGLLNDVKASEEGPNARLIAAAPALLAACIAGLKEVAFDARHDPNLDAVVKQMRAAIAAARGAS